MAATIQPNRSSQAHNAQPVNGEDKDAKADPEKMYPWEYVAWFVTLIAAAETFVSLDLPQVNGDVLHKSLGRVDLSGTFLNVSGSLLEGFFASWDEDWVTTAKPSASAALLRTVSAIVRDSFLASYMSWVGMVEHGGELARLSGAPWVGATYCAVTIALGLGAHAIGISLARASAQVLRTDRQGASSRAANETSMRLTVLVGVASYVAMAFARCYHAKDADIDQSPDEFEVEDGDALIRLLEKSALLRLMVSVAFSIVGASAGNWVGENINANALFAGLNLSCHVLLLTPNSIFWSRSHLLSAFMGSFCGSGSSFGGMCTGFMEGMLNWNDTNKRGSALWSLFLHLAFAVVFVCAFFSFGYYST